LLLLWQGATNQQRWLCLFSIITSMLTTHHSSHTSTHTAVHLVVPRALHRPETTLNHYVRWAMHYPDCRRHVTRLTQPDGHVRGMAGRCLQHAQKGRGAMSSVGEHVMMIDLQPGFNRSAMSQCMEA